MPLLGARAGCSSRCPHLRASGNVPLCVPPGMQCVRTCSAWGPERTLAVGFFLGVAACALFVFTAMLWHPQSGLVPQPQHHLSAHISTGRKLPAPVHAPAPGVDKLLRQQADEAQNLSAVKGAHGGRLFVAVRRRSFKGRRGRFVERPHTVYPKVANHVNCTQWAVITTIFGPTELVKQLLQLPDWCVVVVGDKKSPLTYNVSGTGGERLAFLGPEQQQALPYTIVPLLKWDHFGRKNIGYLYAMHHGAETIYDTDDDNILKVDAGGAPYIPSRAVAQLERPPSEHDTVASNSHVYNPYPSFDPVQELTSTNEFMWPRGFPLDKINDPHTRYGRFVGRDANDSMANLRKANHKGRVTVVQSLADHDPDVDAMFRLTRPLPLRFRPGISPRLEAMPSGTMSPFNAQATLFSRSCFWGMLLPVTVHGRVSDIWRSYFTTRLMWSVGQRVAFSSPWVTQCRNPHSYMADFDAELDLYSRAGPLVAWLLEWQPMATTFAGQIEELAILMFEMDLLHESLDVDLAVAWLHDLQAVGVELPSLIPPSNDNYFKPQPRGKLGKTAVVQSDGSCEQKSVSAPSLWGQGARRALTDALSLWSWLEHCAHSQTYFNHW
eukprot:COSAG01_NODE_365_length_18082_cov_9.136518_13_plen_608_part_00